MHVSFHAGAQADNHNSLADPAGAASHGRTRPVAWPS